MTDACALPSPFAVLGLDVLERGWLSANQLVFGRFGATTPAVVDTGFHAHAEQTVALVEQALAGQRLERIVNTHLHSDHCGGNAALQATGDVRTWVPQPSLRAVQRWDEASLTYRPTGQACPRFAAECALVPGETIELGPASWQIHAAPGHDMDAVLFFEPESRTLVSGDALWESRLAIIFPEFVGQDGFGATRATLALIERLAPNWVVPGHGRPFEDVGEALASSRQRVAAYEREPARHAGHAARALLMFRLLEVRRAATATLADWMATTPVFRPIARGAGVIDEDLRPWACDHLRRLVDDGILQAHGDDVFVPAQAR
ncbi:MAG TPA: MBL fold metallo-hydrolase [Burkholderiaceae bacterium]|jgi:glyoxylase-like metal-dependent hydrolase (beta-lactamase superfamily II)|nr:MBL fold metallo-hydrolase [Burkholderiaceae bacterium]